MKSGAAPRDRHICSSGRYVRRGGPEAKHQATVLLHLPAEGRGMQPSCVNQKHCFGRELLTLLIFPYFISKDKFSLNVEEMLMYSMVLTSLPTPSIE